jgi:RHS repeat-associated protein
MLAYRETAELDGNGVVSAWYVHGLNVDEPLARIDNSTGAVHYYHADILGSIVALTNSTGGVTTQYNYSPFGTTQVIGSDVDNPYRFVGKVYDHETGFIYFPYRNYSDKLGRFISEDPIRFKSGEVNWYVYAANNPINMVDPLGFEWIFQRWVVEEKDTFWLKYRKLLARCVHVNERGEKTKEQDVEAFYQQYRPYLYNVIPGNPSFGGTSSGNEFSDGVHAAVDLAEAVANSGKGTGKVYFDSMRDKLNGQDYCDALFDLCAPY